MDLLIDPDERINLAGSCRSMRGDQCDTVTTRRLLDRGASERMESGGIGHNTLLDCRFQAAGK